MSEKPWLRWCECEVLDEHAKWLMNEEKLSAEEAEKKTREPHYASDVLEVEWHDLTDALSEWIDEMGVHHFYATGEKLGWRSAKGQKYFRATDGAELLRNVLPKTDCTFSVFKEPTGLRIVNSHHDAEGEVYRISPGPEG